MRRYRVTLTRVSISRDESLEINNFFLCRSGELNFNFSFSSRLSRIRKPKYSLSSQISRFFRTMKIFLFHPLHPHLLPPHLLPPHQDATRIKMQQGSRCNEDQDSRRIKIQRGSSCIFSTFLSFSTFLNFSMKWKTMKRRVSSHRLNAGFAQFTMV